MRLRLDDLVFRASDLFVLDLNWMTCFCGKSQSSISFPQFKKLLEKLADSLCATGSVVIRIDEPQTSNSGDDNDADPTEQMNKLTRICKSVFTHAALVKLANWNRQILILSNTALEDCSLLEKHPVLLNSDLFANCDLEIVDSLKFL